MHYESIEHVRRFENLYFLQSDLSVQAVRLNLFDYLQAVDYLYCLLPLRDEPRNFQSMFVDLIPMNYLLAEVAD